MTHASWSGTPRHDTLDKVTKRSGRGTARQTIRVDEGLWERFGQVTTERGTDRSTVIREFIDRYVTDSDAEAGEPDTSAE